MVRADSRLTGAEKLARYILEGLEDPIAVELAGWVASSARFREFAEANRDKIRKKLRGAADAAARRDVRTELRVAQLLLADRRIEVAFESYGSAVGGPDFTISFRGEQAFNLEVTRMRRVQVPTTGAPLLAKLHQLRPSTPNVVLVALGGNADEGLDVVAATRALRARADAKDEAFFQSRGFEGTRGFYRRFLRLSAVLVWREDTEARSCVMLWHNPSARIALPDRATRACVACLGQSSSTSDAA